MFRSNQGHQQGLLFGWDYTMPAEQQERLKQSQGYAFYQHIFCHIDESLFQPLYSKNKNSAPNSPVNCLVGALLLKEQHTWTTEEMMRQLTFNLEIRAALGIFDTTTTPFSERTFFNFKNRLADHVLHTGDHLLSQLFDKLTAEQIEKYQVGTETQRLDSVLLESNIMRHGRLSLLTEILCRLHRVLTPQDQEKYEVLFKPYLKGGQKFVYQLKTDEYETQLEQIGSVYAQLYRPLSFDYGQQSTYQQFERVLHEHFIYQEEAPQNIQPKANKELSASSLQSPDDQEATFRSKAGEQHQGYSITGTETCGSENEINLVTHIVVNTNNTDDAAVLAEELPEMKAKTPELKELHTDGTFGSEQVDEVAAELDEELVIVQSAIRATEAAVPMSIEAHPEQPETYTVDCPNEAHPKVTATKASKNYRADFDLNTCKQCPFYDQCPTRRERKEKKGVGVLRFTIKDARRNERHRALEKLPEERRTLRPAVEALMKQFRRGEKNTGKLPYRGLFKTSLYAFSMGIVINFERIFSYLKAQKIAFTCFLLTLKQCLLPGCQKAIFSSIHISKNPM